MVTLNKSKILELWEGGIISDKAFIYFAISYDSGTTTDAFNLDLGDFSDDWIGVGDGEKKPKRLSECTIRKALADLEKAEKLSLEARQLTLQLF